VGRRSSFLPAFFVPRAIAQEQTRLYDGVNVDSHRFVEPAATTPQEAGANTTVPLMVGIVVAAVVIVLIARVVMRRRGEEPRLRPIHWSDVSAARAAIR